MINLNSFFHSEDMNTDLGKWSYVMNWAYSSIAWKEHRENQMAIHNQPIILFEPCLCLSSWIHWQHKNHGGEAAWDNQLVKSGRNESFNQVKTISMYQHNQICKQDYLTETWLETGQNGGFNQPISGENIGEQLGIRGTEPTKRRDSQRFRCLQYDTLMQNKISIHGSQV